MYLKERAHCCICIVDLTLGRVIYLHWVLTTFNVEDFRAKKKPLNSIIQRNSEACLPGKEPTKLLRIKSRTHDDDFERVAGICPTLALAFEILGVITLPQNGFEISD